MTPLHALMLLLPVASALAGLGFTSAPAGAQTAGETPAADPCVAVFADSARTNRNLQLHTSAPPGSDARPGQEIGLGGSWDPTRWDAVTGLSACVEVADRVEPTLGGVEEPPVNDGSFSHQFTVPAGLTNGTVICLRVRLAGDPAGVETSGEWISRQACFEVHPEGADTPATTAPPTTTPTTAAPPPINPPTTSPTTRPPAAPTTTVAKPAGSPAPPAVPVEAPEPPAQSTVSFAAPDEPEVSSQTPRPRRPTVPVPMRSLPRTGAGPGPLALAGTAAVAAGLPMVFLRRRR